MVCMLTLSRHSPIVCGGIGAITPMVGAAILTMVGDGTVGMDRAGASVGADGMQAVGGDTITTTTIIIRDITTAVIGEVITGVAVTGRTMLIQTDALTAQAVPHTRAIEACLPLPVVPLLWIGDRQSVAAVRLLIPVRSVAVLPVHRLPAG